MIKDDQFIKVRFSEDNIKVYFNTNEKDIKYGVEYSIFCEYKPLEEIDFTDFWYLSDKSYNEMKEKGMLVEIETIKDIMV